MKNYSIVRVGHEYVVQADAKSILKVASRRRAARLVSDAAELMEAQPLPPMPLQAPAAPSIDHDPGIIRDPPLIVDPQVTLDPQLTLDPQVILVSQVILDPRVTPDPASAPDPFEVS